MTGSRLAARLTPGAGAEPGEAGGTRLLIPPGPPGVYRLAQLDDYARLARRVFPHRAPFEFAFQARASETGLSGTWGFGVWNDPFGLSLGLGGAPRRLPALPNAAWFFHASPQNHLAFGDRSAAQGFLAGVFSAPRLPGWLVAPGLPALALLGLPPAARLIRRAISNLVDECACGLDVDVTGWHDYRLACDGGRTRFQVDGGEVFSAPIAPRGPLGLVIWIDNQFAAFPPDGRVRAGSLETVRPAWMEVQFRY